MPTDQLPQEDEKRRRFEEHFPDPRGYASQSDYLQVCRAYYRKCGVSFDMGETYRVYALWIDAHHTI